MVGGQVLEAVRSGGLLGGEGPVVAMLSGGRDSSCLLDVAVRLRGAAAVRALHVNYGLRECATTDERHCVALCEGLGVHLEVVHAPSAEAPGGPPDGGAGARKGAWERVQAPSGNLQAWAREIRYGAGLRLAEASDGVLAAGHTSSDQVETILYRLAASPGRRALLGMPEREGRLVRPLLGVSREQTAEYCRERRLGWREDESNEDLRFARTRVRVGLLPALRAVHPAAEANVLRTAALLREETELLDGLVASELGQGGAIALPRLEELPSALARMVVIRLAEEASGSFVPQAGDRVQELIALGRRGGRAELHVGGRAGAVVEDGRLRMIRLPPRAPGMAPGEG
ncbi:MAG TPA: tRNA lysidine(34) synthetase [Solirubrobacteraceae bacterium]|nr:tRNA lysidine(34) synthetase [Solirubrobacteraceae bacterium]